MIQKDKGEMRGRESGIEIEGKLVASFDGAALSGAGGRLQGQGYPETGIRMKMKGEKERKGRRSLLASKTEIWMLSLPRATTATDDELSDRKMIASVMGALALNQERQHCPSLLRRAVMTQYWPSEVVFGESFHPRVCSSEQHQRLRYHSYSSSHYFHDYDSDLHYGLCCELSLISWLAGGESARDWLCGNGRVLV